MNKEIVTDNFFQQPPLSVAHMLLGKTLVRCIDATTYRYIIIETEAYLGKQDLASHARFGRTKRSETMYASGGTCYVYLCYGIHALFNIVTGCEGEPSAVLIRGILDKSGEVIIGPGRVSKRLDLDQSFNGTQLGKPSGLWVENGPHLPQKGSIKRLPRVGVDYAGLWAKKPYRFQLIEKFLPKYRK